MNKTKNENIKNYLADFISNQLFDLLNNKFKPNLNYNVIQHPMTIQFWYDEIFNRVYITYELGIYLRYEQTKFNWLYICKYINGLLLNNFYRDIRSYPNIIGPTIKLYYENNNSNRLDFSDEYIRPNTYSVWKTGDGSYKYIESPSADSYIQGYLLGINDSSIYSKFCEELLKFNADNVVGVDNPNKLEIFNKYAEVFKKYFNRQLSPVPDNEIISFTIEDLNTINTKTDKKFIYI